MLRVRSTLGRGGIILVVIAFLLMLATVNISFFAVGKASASQLTSRSLKLSSSAPGTVTTGAAGSYTNGNAAAHTFTFTTPTGSASTKSFKFEYCTTAISTCTAPTGLTVTGYAISVQTDDTVTFVNAFAADTAGQTANVIKIKNATGNNVAGGSVLVFTFTGIDNPDEIDAFFVHISMYSDDTYTTLVDDGTVANATVDPITITSRVKERLGFSVTTNDNADGSTGNNTNVTPEIGTTSCDPLVGGGSLTIGDAEGVLSSTAAFNEYSYFRIYTNAVGGVFIQYSGDTLKKGTDDIDALSSEVVSSPGTEQFGFGIVNGVTGVSGTDTSFPGTAGTLSLAAGYDEGGAGTPKFNFSTGSVSAPVTIASSSGFVTCDTAQVKYLANIAETTPAGTYTATITYYALPTF